MNTTINSLVFDLKVFAASSRVTKNVLAVRTAATAELDPFFSEDSFILDANDSIELSPMANTLAFCLYASNPVDVTCNVDGNIIPITFSNQTMLVVTSSVTNVTAINGSSEKTMVYIARLGTPEVAPIPENYIWVQPIIFAPLARIAELPFTINTLTKVKVKDITQAPFTNSQILPFSFGGNAIEKFRICDADGTANPTGKFIAYLDDKVTQQNFSGTLSLTVGELQ